MTKQIFLPCDICRCLGKDCAVKDSCKRHLAEAGCCTRVSMSENLCGNDGQYKSKIEVEET